MEEGLGNNTTLQTTDTHNCTPVIHPYYDTTEQIIKYTSICIAPLGIPGNILAFLVWIRPNMRRSFGVYMALLAVTQTMLLAGRIIYDLVYGWHLSVTDYPVVCELYMLFSYFCQYIEPLLYLAFSVERYISVYHPFKCRQYCTTKRAIHVSISFTCLSLVTSSMQAYFFTYDDSLGCHGRKDVSESFWNIWSIFTESVYFLLVPVTVLVLNIFVIRGVNKSRNRSSFYGNNTSNSRPHDKFRNRLSSNSSNTTNSRPLDKFRNRLSSNSSNTSNSRPRDKVAANSKLLLYVSFYFIISVLPVSVAYLLWKVFPVGHPCVIQEDDSTWVAHHKYLLARAIVESVTHLHYAINFYIYMFIGKTFRKEFCKMMLCCYPRFNA